MQDKEKAKEAVKTAKKVVVSRSEVVAVASVIRAAMEIAENMGRGGYKSKAKAAVIAAEELLLEINGRG